MSATNELRRLLDERGVEWKAWDGAHPITVWHDETYLYEFIEYRLVNGAKQVSNCPSDNDGHCELTIKVFNCTPEQAIAATLGPAARHPKPHEQWTTVLLPEIAWDWGDKWPDYLSVAHDAHGEWRVYVPEATLGRDPDDAAMVKLHDQMNAAMLKYEMAQGIERRDGDDAIVVPWVVKMHALLEEAATIGSCNCSNNCTNSERTGTCLPHFWTHDGTLHVELPKLPDSISVRLPDQRDREVRSARTWQYTRDSGTCHECAGMDDMFECSACGGRYEGWALKRWARYCPDCGRRVVGE